MDSEWWQGSRQAGPGTEPLGRRDRAHVLPLPRPSARHLAEQPPLGCGPSGRIRGSAVCSRPLTLGVHRDGRLVTQEQAGAGDPICRPLSRSAPPPCSRPHRGSDMAALASPPLPLDPTTGSVFSDKDQGSEVSGPRIVLSVFFFFFNTL